MCGLAGALRLDCRNDTWRYDLCGMAASIAHRGPDAEDIWFDAEAGVGLAHRRLSILDLSPQGAQPMISADGRFVIAYNGEVYNFAELRDALRDKGIAWRGHSDTEVILAAIQTWGLTSAVEKFIGMFAFALWDRQGRVLSLVRDRLGIKPLYYGWGRRSFLFGSELKALRAHSDFQPVLNRDAVALQLRHNYVPAPHSIYAGVYKLEPGRILSVPLAAIEARDKVSVATYWSAEEVAQEGQKTAFRGSAAEATDELERLLCDAVKIRMVADVPLGAFLSGGIDSSTVVALMQAQSSDPVRTFTIGFGEDGFDEAKNARAVAEYLGTEHSELYVSPEDAMAVIPKLPDLYDEPFSDSSQIPTHLVSAMARRAVTVCLSGDGGDELFAGYGRYSTGRDIWAKMKWGPAWMRRMLAGTLAAAPDELLRYGFSWLEPLLAKHGVGGQMPEKLRTLAEILRCRSHGELYHRLVSHWKDPSAVVFNSCEPATQYSLPNQAVDRLHPTHRMMLLDTLLYLPDDILTKVDRASMGVGLEARVPLLDHRVVEFAWRLPLPPKASSGEEKWALRQVLYKHLPSALVDRPKMGFSVPIASWLRGPLRDWAESLIDQRRLTQEGIFDPTPVRNKWDEHLSGSRDWHYYLWDVLMFQAWKEASERKPEAAGLGTAADWK